MRCNLVLDKIGAADGGGELDLGVVVGEDAEQVEVLEGDVAEGGVPRFEEVVDEQHRGDFKGAVGVLPHWPPDLDENAMLFDFTRNNIGDC